MGKAAHSVRISDRRGGMSGPNGDEWLTFAFHLLRPPTSCSMVLNMCTRCPGIVRHVTHNVMDRACDQGSADRGKNLLFYFNAYL